MDALRKEIDELKPILKSTLMSFQGIDSTKKRILMIYLWVSLGLAYHFEEEIYETLKEGFENIEKMMDGEDDLYTTSIIFWVFRRYGHHISSGKGVSLPKLSFIIDVGTSVFFLISILLCIMTFIYILVNRCIPKIQREQWKLQRISYWRCQGYVELV